MRKKRNLDMSIPKNKVALITGVSRRKSIGFGIAEQLAQKGYDLFLHSFISYDKMMHIDLSPDEIENIRKELTDHTIRVEQMDLDFEIKDSTDRLFKFAIKKFEHIDILIINHTYDPKISISNLTSYEIDKHLIINIRASLLLIKDFIKYHDGRPGGRIILLTSGQDIAPQNDELAYIASKGALHQITKSLSDIVIDKGITVNTVNPGPTETFNPDEELNKAVLDRMPLKRWGQPEDVGRLIGWLVSADAQWVTGQIINSEGGFRRG